MTLPAGSSLSESIKLSKKRKDIDGSVSRNQARSGEDRYGRSPHRPDGSGRRRRDDHHETFQGMDQCNEPCGNGREDERSARTLSERAEFNFSQPIQLRFNELMTGAKADIAVKLYGEDTHELYQRAKEAATYVEKVPGQQTSS